MSNEGGYIQQSNTGKKKKEFVNNSGGGKNIRVPSIVSKHFNWGAFLFTWVWGIANKSYLTFLIWLASVMYSFIALFISDSIINIIVAAIGLIISLGLQIWFGVKGNEWAWRNKRFKSVEHFHRIQRKWAATGLIISLIITLIMVIFIFFIFFITITSINASNNKYEIISAQKKCLSSINQAATLNYALDEGKNIRLTSKGLAEYFALHMSVAQKQGNILILNDGAVLEFNGDGSCRQYGNCLVKVDVNGEKGPNKEDEDIMILHLQKNNDGSLEMDKSDYNKYVWEHNEY